MTILIAFHQLGYRHFKGFYTHPVSVYWRAAFPGLGSYKRFVEWMPSVLLPLCAYLRSCLGTCSWISFVDSTCLKVCHNRRIKGHKVFDGLAARGKTSMDWFFGFKLHLVVNDRGELLNVLLTTGNIDYRQHRRPETLAQTAQATAWQSLFGLWVDCLLSSTQETLACP